MISILYVSNTEKMSGAEFSLLSLMRGLDRTQFQSLLLLPGEGLFAECARKAGIELQIVPSMVRFGEAFRLRVLPRVAICVWQIMKIIRCRRIRIVHVNSPRAAYIGALAGRLAGAFTLTHVRDIEQSPFASRTKSRLLGFLSDRIVAVSRATAHAILTVNPALRGKVEVIYNGIDRKEMAVRPAAETRGCLGISSAAPLIGCAGILHPAKGQDILIRAAARIQVEFPEFRALLIGQVFHASDAGYEIKLKKLVAELGIKDNIIFTGFRNDVFDLIQAMDVFVHPAVFQDPLPRILLEAAACGRPIVATNTGGIPEIIQDGISGLLVEPGNADALADAVLALLRHPDKAKRLGQAAMKRIEQVFSLRGHISALTVIYRSFVSKGG
jgi:glycosyltransferase involved in cell wall biosynthesis